MIVVMKLTAPKIVPKTYIDSTPRYWGESDPYRSLTIANEPSRSIENVAPTVAGPMRRSTASGSARAIVPNMWPTSCSSSAGPAFSSSGKFGPIVNDMRAMRKSTATPMMTVAACCRSIGKGFSR